MEPESLTRNPAFIRILLAAFTPTRWIHRIRFEGAEGIPERPCVLVANHSIGAVVEVFAILYAWEKRFGFRGDRPAYGLAHRVAFRVPIVAAIMKGVGAIPADFGSAKRALDSGASVLVFPGGNWEATRSFRRRNEVDFAGHRGWIRVAKDSGVDVIPVSISGSHRVNPVFGRSLFLARLSLFEALFRVRWVPVTLGQFLWAALFVALFREALPGWALAIGAFTVFCLTPLVAIWPARITIRFGEPIPSTAPADDLYREVPARIAADLARRASPRIRARAR